MSSNPKRFPPIILLICGFMLLMFACGSQNLTVIIAVAFALVSLGIGMFVKRGR